MNNLPLQPLKWFETEHSVGLIPNIGAQGAGIFYRIAKVGDKAAVTWHDQSEGSTGAKELGSVCEAKNWIATDHYPSKMQPYVKPDSIGAHFDNFTQWANDRQIIQNGDILAQGLKLVSEIGELADNLAKDRCIKDDIGDCMVVLNNLAHMTDTPLADCLAQAWNDIKDRKGTMNEHGVFIKDGDIEEKL